VADPDSLSRVGRNPWRARRARTYNAGLGPLGRSPQRGPGQSPWGKAESFSVLRRRKKIANLPFSCVLGSGYVRAAARSTEKALKSAPDSVLAIVEASVCPSHSAVLSKRCKLRSWNLHCRLPERLYSFRIRKAFPEIRTGSPRLSTILYIARSAREQVAEQLVARLGEL